MRHYRVPFNRKGIKSRSGTNKIQFEKIHYFDRKDTNSHVQEDQGQYKEVNAKKTTENFLSLTS